ncbi:TPA: helix-turn-helix domain-containing protein [Vibrio vulnificus]|uniref:helix-turn-helix domain-containing protein n=1 Tax=Vibrio sp. 05-20-BW147 TaxID=2575834 RepID=UPI001594B528|nr:AraC family transcriptional regulator [Vibrio sp. 05-20-BW147]NVC65139.1 helix-turn-helix transcriptional regulator [Vibrio sp. 05-20-BW147]HAS6349504.1 helix-turn-helix domain-containing protein [Vibrio vulnificus]
MKPFIENILSESNFTWLVKEYRCDGPIADFACPWHYHAEYELVLYSDPENIFDRKYFAGDAIERATHNTLLLYGPGLPHMVTGTVNHAHHSPHRTIIIWFSHQWIEDVIKTIPEAHSLLRMLRESKYGLRFSEQSSLMAAQLLSSLSQKSRKFQALGVIEALLMLAEDTLFKRVSHAPYQLKTSSEHESTNKRLLLAKQFIENNFAKSIRIDDLCLTLHMSESSAYRLFEKHYGCSFSEHLKQYRIGKACEQLVRSELPIQLIAEETGFLNLSNFNRQFKKVKSMTPSEFRAQFR